MSNKVDTETIIKQCENLNLEYVGRYIKKRKNKSETCVKFRCKVHYDKGIQESFWSSFKTASKGCAYCTGRYKTTEEFREEILEINPTIEIIGEYSGSEKPVACRCRVCNTVWHPIGRSLKNGQGCPICANVNRTLKRRKKHEEFIADMQRANKNIKIISRYKNSKTEVKCKCLIDGCEWLAIPSNLLNENTKCPECTKRKLHDKQAFSTEEFRLLIDDLNIEPVDEYYNTNTKIRFKCRICHNSFEMRPRSILYKHSGCPFCNSTAGERKLEKLLFLHGYECIPQFSFPECRNINPLRFDFYNPEHNIAFEYNGEQHYRPVDFAGKGEEWSVSQLKLNQKRDKIKFEFCKNNNIPLIIIPYWEFDNMENYLISQLSYIEQKAI